MKLLLTSAGLANKSITTALVELLGKPSDGVKLTFIPALDISRKKAVLLSYGKNT